MKIKKTDFNHYRNNALLQFFTEIIRLLLDVTPEALKIEALFAKFQACFKDLDEAMLKIPKSEFTDDIVEADRGRDGVTRGMLDANASMLNHFAPEKVAAAKRLQIIFNTYGNITRLPFNEQTAATTGLLQELNDNHADDIALTGLGDWVEELGKQNTLFGDLVNRRYDESAAQTSLKVQQVRKEITAAYRDLVAAIEGLSLVDTTGIYKDVITRLNVIVEKYDK
jgi:hypothetical protein